MKFHDLFSSLFSEFSRRCQFRIFFFFDMLQRFFLCFFSEREREWNHIAALENFLFTLLFFSANTRDPVKEIFRGLMRFYRPSLAGRKMKLFASQNHLTFDDGSTG